MLVRFRCARGAGLLLACAIVSIGLSALFASPEAAAADKIRSGWYEDAYNITGRHGERSGYGYEYLQAMAGYTGWNYDYVKGGWSELLASVASGDIDIMGAVSYTPERAQAMLYSEVPMGFERYYLYADLVNAGISTTDLSTLNGKRLAVLKDSIQTDQFREWEKAHGIAVNYVYVKSFEEAKAMVAAHEIDCVISTETPAWVEAGLSAIAITGCSEIYFVINKRRPDLKRAMDAAMRQMERDRPFYADELYQRYLSAVAVPTLSASEKAWLAAHGPVRLGWMEGETGFSRTNDEGRLEGVINDYLNLAVGTFANQGLAFELVRFTSREAELAALKEGRIDVVFHVSSSPYAAEVNGLALSNTLLTMTLAAVTKQDYFIEAAENRVAVPMGNLLVRWHIAYKYPNWTIVDVATTEEAKKAVLDGRADCLVVPSGQTLAAHEHDTRLRSVFLTESGDAVMAVKRGESTLLMILNKTLQPVSASTLSGALSMYESAARRVTTMDYLRANLGPVAVVTAVIVLAVLAVFAWLLAKARGAAHEASELNRRLEVAVRAAREANDAKTSFLFNMSHDIRTPMNALLGFSKMIKEGLTDPKLLGYQAKMEQSGNLLLSIINNVLDMARIESGKMELDETDDRVGSIIDEIAGVFEVEAQKKGVAITHECRVEHRHVRCDATKVREILTNLVSNAVKFTPSGGSVTIRCEEIPSKRPGFVRLRTEVVDTGIGISPEFLPTIFEPFTRERNTTAGRVAGTGLGMAIVKKLVDMMKGKITVESTPGRGSRFVVTLEHPMAKAAAQAPEAEPTLAESGEALRGRRVLLAEDNDLNAEIALFILEKLGLAADRVADGRQCVARLEVEPAGYYDAVLMDIQMPVMDGYEAARAVRAMADAKKAGIPIIAMTANAFEEDRQNAAKAGMNGHVAKPVDAEKVKAALLKVWR